MALPEPDEGVKAANPRQAEPVTATWPTDRLADRRAALSEAVETVLARMKAVTASRDDDAPSGDPHRADDGLGVDAVPDHLTGRAREIELLLRERGPAAGRGTSR